jgi:hypothetical protein
LFICQFNFNFSAVHFPLKSPKYLFIITFPISLAAHTDTRTPLVKSRTGEQAQNGMGKGDEFDHREADGGRVEQECAQKVSPFLITVNSVDQEAVLLVTEQQRGAEIEEETNRFLNDKFSQVNVKKRNLSLFPLIYKLL